MMNTIAGKKAYNYGLIDGKPGSNPKDLCSILIPWEHKTEERRDVNRISLRLGTIDQEVLRHGATFEDYVEWAGKENTKQYRAIQARRGNKFGLKR